MTIELAEIARNAAILLALMIAGFVIERFGRLISGWAFVSLFCLGQFGWAFLALVIFSTLDNEHRRFMASARARRFYNGPWID